MTSKPNRPLSPHLQVYKLPLTALISISHRMTGVMLSIGLIFIVCILSSVAGGAETYTDIQKLFDFVLVKLIYWGFIYALFFHLCHGVRHLIWDAGETFDRDRLNRYAAYELAASALLTVFSLIFI